MTKAQEVRSRRHSLRKSTEIDEQKILIEETKKIFDWILDFMDQETKRGVDEEIVVYLTQESKYDRTLYWNGHPSSHYDLSELLKKFNKVEILTELKKVIEKEEGFKARLDFTRNLNSQIWINSAVLTLTIVIM